MDINILQKKLNEYNAVILSIDNSLILVSPKEVPDDFKSEVRISFPDVTIKFIISIKPSTEGVLLEIMKASGIPFFKNFFKIEGKKLTVTLKAEETSTLEINAVIKALKNAIEDDGYIEVLKFKINDEETTYNIGKPLIITTKARIEPITKADIMDLNIVLMACKDVNELLEVI